MAITSPFNADKYLCEKISVLLAASTSAKFIVEKAVTVTHVSFYNQSGSAFTSAAAVVNVADTIVSSAANLGAGLVEEKEGVSLANTLVSDGSTVTITSGDQISFIVLTIESLQE